MGLIDIKAIPPIFLKPKFCLKDKVKVFSIISCVDCYFYQSLMQFIRGHFLSIVNIIDLKEFFDQDSLIHNDILKIAYNQKPATNVSKINLRG